MDEKNDNSGEVNESRATYRKVRRLAKRGPVKEVLAELAEIRKLTKGRAGGKDSVTLVREERDR